MIGIFLGKNNEKKMNLKQKKLIYLQNRRKLSILNHLKVKNKSHLGSYIQVLKVLMKKLFRIKRFLLHVLSSLKHQILICRPKRNM
uniref:Macaca fascicularis brain cDNA clone: QflA-19069, similar to human ankyrin repeat domain 12 (ANKRD12), mRNA, RefSeq: NM_015208.2 n=1 Tax=Macaca fascicularis TaxID=9541 RepID=I7GCD9_MACFA|nr:unnamed protein product [Macaca fascicularis]